MMKGLIGKKLGMTSVYDESGTAVPVTVIEAGPCVVVQCKDAEKDGYLDYLKKLLPLVRPGGLVLAHNMTERMARADFATDDAGVHRVAEYLLGRGGKHPAETAETRHGRSGRWRV